LASGSIILSGTSQEPVLKGEIEIVRGAFIVDYLNVAYSFSNKVFFKENEKRLKLNNAICDDISEYSNEDDNRVEDVENADE
jgi:hypothetical protein